MTHAVSHAQFVVSLEICYASRFIRYVSRKIVMFHAKLALSRAKFVMSHSKFVMSHAKFFMSYAEFVLFSDTQMSLDFAVLPRLLVNVYQNLTNFPPVQILCLTLFCESAFGFLAWSLSGGILWSLYGEHVT
jgi:hypothetical protein